MLKNKPKTWNKLKGQLRTWSSGWTIQMDEDKYAPRRQTLTIRDKLSGNGWDYADIFRFYEIEMQNQLFSGLVVNWATIGINYRNWHTQYKQSLNYFYRASNIQTFQYKYGKMHFFPGWSLLFIRNPSMNCPFSNLY